MFINSFFLQSQTNQQIITGISIGVIVLLFLVAIVIYFVFTYQKKQQLNQIVSLKMQESFQQELIITQAEVKEQTLQTIAGDLHDNIGQLLSLTKATLSSIDFIDTNKSTQKLNTSIELVNTSIKELRQLSKLYHAESLLENGLFSAIEQEVEHLKKTDQFIVNLTKSFDKEYLPIPKTDLFIFRLLQESFNNIIKHANASTIEITIQLLKNIFHVTIADNGIGFDINLSNNKMNGIGIVNMKKRVTLIGGHLLINSEINKGTTVYIEVPYENNI